MVEFRDADDARSALIRDGKYFGDRAVEVRAATDCTLFVTNYPPEADEHYIRDLFKNCGQIHNVRFPSLKFNMKRRFCYVSFRERSAAAAAAKLNNKPLEGGKYKLLAKFSDPGMKQHRHGAIAEERELHVNNIPRSMTEEALTEFFNKAGKVMAVRLPRPGAAFVVMETKEEAQEAIKTLDKVMFGTHPLKVELSVPRGAKTTATVGGDVDSTGTRSPSPMPSDHHPDRNARTIALLGIPDTMNEARVHALLAPKVGTITKLVVHPQHGGAVVEFGDAAAAGKAALTVDGMRIEGGGRLRVTSVAEMYKSRGETRIDRIDVKSDNAKNGKDKGGGEKESAGKKKMTAAELMPPPSMMVRRPLGKAGPKRKLPVGLGASAIKKEENEKAGAPGGEGGAAPAPKSNADFKKMFLGGK